MEKSIPRYTNTWILSFYQPIMVIFVEFIVNNKFNLLNLLGGKLPAINYSGKDWYPSVSEHLDHIEKWNTFGFANQK